MFSRALVRHVRVKRLARPPSRPFPIRRLVPLALAWGTLLAAWSASPAAGTATGGCQGAGTIGSTRHSAAELDPARPVTVPDEADVAYEGSVPLSADGTVRAHSGRVDLRLPLGASVTVADWSGSSGEVGAAGVHHYTVPAIVPRGVVVPVDVTHRHEGLTAPCTGAFAIQLEGGPLDSPVPTGVAVGGTLLSGAALVSAVLHKGGRP